MVEILWHGRGGQGAFTAARLLGAAASLDDAVYALAFPSFGPERRGAPMRAFTKINNAPIGDRSAIKTADYVVYLDETLLDDSWEGELKPTGCVLVNSQKPDADFSDERIIAIDANRISTDILGRPIPNTVFLGALAALGVLDVDQVKSAIEGYMAPKLHASNKQIVDAAYEHVKEKMARKVSAASAAADSLDESVKGASVEAMGDASTAKIEGDPAAATEDDGVEGVSSLARALCAHRLSERTAAHIPTLQNDRLDPSAFARSTCFTAGHLVDKNAGWRNVRPVIDETLCTNCLQCYLHCPDGTIYKVASHRAKKPFSVAIDYDFCKGCGVCVKACAFGAITMVDEPTARKAEALEVQESLAGTFAQAHNDSSSTFESEVQA